MGKNTDAYTQSFIPIKDIQYGLIITTENRHIKIIEIEPINFNLRNVQEQENIIQSFAGWLKVCPVRMQFKVITRAADASQYIDTLERHLEKETNSNCKMLGEHYTDLIRRIGSQEAVSRRFFIIFEYEPASEMYRFTETPDIAMEMNRVVTKTKGFFNSIGNEIIEHEKEDYFLTELLYMYYNRRSCITETFDERVERIVSDAKKIHGLSDRDPLPFIPISDLIAPRGIDFTNSKYVIMDGLYQCHLYIDSKGYPTTTYGGWLSNLVTIGDGVDVDIHLKKESRSTFFRQSKSQGPVKQN